MTAQALLNASSRIAAKSQLAIKQGRKGNVVRLSQKR
jgi:t-SNARE complex subunit (syntaxin)